VQAPIVKQRLGAEELDLHVHILHQLQKNTPLGLA
jgi:hypothetical protein